MDLLKAEINRKRKAAEEIIAQIGTSSTIGNSKYIRQGDLRKIEEDKRISQQKILDEQRSAPVKLINNSNVHSDVVANPPKSVMDFSSLTVSQIKLRLRELGRPITLFGESESDRLQRLVTLQSEEQQDDDFKLGSGHNISNTFLTNRNVVHSIDKEDDDDEDDNEDGDEDKESNKLLKKPVFREVLFSRIPDLPPEKVIYKYFRSLTKLWEWDLNEREDHEKRTAKGKLETKTQKQCKDYIRPLYKLCKRKDVPPDILANLFQIVKFCEDGDFRSAHDIYLKTAIGNAAWPIGLTMVGIHERSGREKISTSKVAHIMNNESQRKYLTSIKRLMTFAQRKSPDVAPSMKTG